MPDEATEPLELLPDDLPTYYSNSTRIQHSLNDFVLVLFRSEFNPSSYPPRVHRGLARIMMSPQHVKAVARLLTQQVEAYEKKFGPIPDPT